MPQTPNSAQIQPVVSFNFSTWGRAAGAAGGSQAVWDEHDASAIKKSAPNSYLKVNL